MYGRLFFSFKLLTIINTWNEINYLLLFTRKKYSIDMTCDLRTHSEIFVVYLSYEMKKHSYYNTELLTHCYYSGYYNIRIIRRWDQCSIRMPWHERWTGFIYREGRTPVNSFVNTIFKENVYSIDYNHYFQYEIWKGL